MVDRMPGTVPVCGLAQGTRPHGMSGSQHFVLRASAISWPPSFLKPGGRYSFPKIIWGMEGVSFLGMGRCRDRGGPVGWLHPEDVGARALADPAKRGSPVKGVHQMCEVSWFVAPPTTLLRLYWAAPL